jgi:hypothetical protein
VIEDVELVRLIAEATAPEGVILAFLVTEAALQEGEA